MFCHFNSNNSKKEYYIYKKNTKLPNIGKLYLNFKDSEQNQVAHIMQYEIAVRQIGALICSGTETEELSLLLALETYTITVIAIDTDSHKQIQHYGRYD